MIRMVVDHRADEKALKWKDIQRMKKGSQPGGYGTTKGWRLCVEWKDGTTSWKPLKVMKELNPVEVAEYAIRHGIAEEPAFAWWVPHVIKRKERIAAAVSERVRKTSHKYGIKIPQNIIEAYQFDKDNGNDLWRRAIAKEMKNVSIAFDIKETGESVPPDYIKSTYHMRCLT